jgi:hypothetical protein
MRPLNNPKSYKRWQNVPEPRWRNNSFTLDCLKCSLRRIVEKQAGDRKIEEKKFFALSGIIHVSFNEKREHVCLL